MLLHRYPQLEVRIVNDEPLPERYRFLPDVEAVDTPETFAAAKSGDRFDVGVIVDGGIDRAGRVRAMYESCGTRVFIDHHVVSVEYPYDVKIVESSACSTTELMFHISQTPLF